MLSENISVFDIFKIGIGPSSSHTLGPWKAALRLLDSLNNKNLLHEVVAINVLLYGSLAKTGVGHGTDIAVQLGLRGEDPETIDTASVSKIIGEIAHAKKIDIGRQHSIAFDPAADITFLFNETLPFHPNALSFLVTFLHEAALAETYYSVGGGFVIKEGEQAAVGSNIKLPYPVNNAAELLAHCEAVNIPVSEIVHQNELAWHDETVIMQKVKDICNVMESCIYKGCHTDGVLPGGLQLKRRAFMLNRKLMSGKKYNDIASWKMQVIAGGNDFKYVMDWINCFALAVNEENASFGRIVTAPTNGAAGVIPAVLFYYLLFCAPQGVGQEERAARFLFTAAEIGSLFKKRATISAAMGGCQAEIGVSAAMAAAALTECLGGTPPQVLMAAEIAMEHHLGLTCDPVNGLVQIPCIERNTMGAIKAINAAQLALQGNAINARVSLDQVIQTMWSTALDMNSKYKETADGGLAVHVPLGLSEC